MPLVRATLVFILFSLTHATAAEEFATPWKKSGASNSRIILETSEVSLAGVSRAGVHIRLGDGWWTYWRAPGSSGIPPQFDWSGSKNITGNPELKWPVPLRAIAFGESLNLYRNEIVFPVEFRAKDPRQPVVLRLNLSYGICKNMCVPAAVKHEIIIPPQAKTAIKRSISNTRLISSFTQRQPTSDPSTTGFEIKEVWEKIDRRTIALELRIQGLSLKRRPLVLVEGMNIFKATEPLPQETAALRETILRVPLGSSRDLKNLTGKRIRLTIMDGNRALEQVWVVGAHSNSAAGTGLTPISATNTDTPQP